MQSKEGRGWNQLTPNPAPALLGAEGAIIQKKGGAMKISWDEFIFSFCKVEFLCWGGEPNWLGWIVLGMGGLIAGIIGLVIMARLSD